MKKLLSLLIVLTLCLMVPLTAYAEEMDAPGKSASKDVTAKYQESPKTFVYSVDVT